MSKDIVFNKEKKSVNPTCIMPDKSQRSYVSLNLQSSVLVKDKNRKRYIQGMITGQIFKNARWFYKVQTLKFIKWCGPDEFKIVPEK